ncbi:hypothetical protein J7M07_02325 [bacterium]|nr:hypothetical protein [bacterium]
MNIEGDIVSSTKIRNDILDGKTERVKRYLTRNYFFDAQVVKGRNLGHKLDFPTANLVVTDSHKLIPPGGVYSVAVEIDQSLYAGMMNIGTSPTVKSDNKEGIEVNLFGFSGDIYGTQLRIHCIKFIREERLFKNLGELRQQLIKDRELATRIFEGNE